MNTTQQVEHHTKPSCLAAYHYTVSWCHCKWEGLQARRPLSSCTNYVGLEPTIMTSFNGNKLCVEKGSLQRSKSGSQVTIISYVGSLCGVVVNAPSQLLSWMHSLPFTMCPGLFLGWKGQKRWGVAHFRDWGSGGISMAATSPIWAN